MVGATLCQFPGSGLKIPAASTFSQDIHFGSLERPFRLLGCEEAGPHEETMRVGVLASSQRDPPDMGVKIRPHDASMRGISPPSNPRVSQLRPQMS